MAGEESDLSRVVDFPVVALTKAGTIAATRARKPDMREPEWTAWLMGKFDKWRDLVNLTAAKRIDLEKYIAPVGVRTRTTRSLGLCRADAIIWHSDDCISIVEAKITSSPTDVCGAIGQLIYYKTLAENYWGVRVCALIVASRYLPPFVLDAIANVRAPVRFLKATDDECIGLVPQYDDIDLNIQAERA
jgi:hypothetical protein